MSECKRHGFPYGIDAARSQCAKHGPHYAPYYVERCAHLGNRFVVDIRPTDGHAFFTVDYVEDLENPYPSWDDVIVEGHSFTTESDAEHGWLQLQETMLAGVAPNPARGY